MYGIIISLAIAFALYLGEKIAKDNNFDTNIYWGASLWAIIGGVVGARMYHVVDYADYYLTKPIRVLYLHQGGLAIYGALLGGTIGLLLYLRGKKEPFLKYLNLAAIVIPLAQAIGRLANWSNMELYGKPTSLPWGLYVPPQFRTDAYRYNDVFHPLFIYESLLDILLFFVLWLLYQRKTMLQNMLFSGSRNFSMKGFFTLTYLLGYGIIRFSLEFLRIDPWQIAGANVAQVISLLFIAIGVLGLYSIVKPKLPLPRK